MFNYILQELRLDSGLTQDALADKLCVTRSALSKYETGENNPTMDFLIRCSNFFNVSADYLLGITRVRTSPNTLYSFKSHSNDDFKKINDILVYLRDNKKYIGYIHSMITELEKLK